MVNVAQYQIVATGNTVSQCEQAYIERLRSDGLTTEEALPQTEASGAVAEIRSAVLEGNTYYFLRLEGEEVFYALSAAENPLAVILNVGDRVTVSHAASEEEAAILDGYTLTVEGKAEAQVTLPEPEEETPDEAGGQQPAAEGENP